VLSAFVLGGYGFFGARIARALASDPRIRVFIGGRDLDRARATARELGQPPDCGVAVDARAEHFPAFLRTLKVDVVVHTAGPFQDQRYDVAQAAIEAGCHYIDIADGRAFVAGIESLDEAARQKGVAVVSGASSVPALSSAVVERYRCRFRALSAIRIGIASGGRSPGLATVRGIFGYAGRPFTRLERGEWVTSHGWMDLRRHSFPEPLGRRWISSCDVPDLELLPARYPGVETVTFHAGFTNSLGHLTVYALAAAVRAGVLRSAVPCAGPLSYLARLLEPLVSHRGGMFVTLEGIDHDGAESTLTWHLLAAQNHGPQIPCAAAIALVRRLAGNRALPPGAFPCVGLLTVEEYLAPLRHLEISEIVP
jgi:saccharopine dehydrogenase-like NADP-dependent oxidoreductase